MDAQSKEALREISPVGLAPKLVLSPELSWKHLQSKAIRNIYILNVIVSDYYYY